jgi:hypothetical protein
LPSSTQRLQIGRADQVRPHRAIDLAGDRLHLAVGLLAMARIDEAMAVRRLLNALCPFGAIVTGTGTKQPADVITFNRR